MKLTCDVVGDLLPVYAEDLTSEASTQLVQEHLENCSQCRTLLQSIKEDRQTEMAIQVEIAPLKKYRQQTLKWRLLCVLLALMLVGISIPAVVAAVPDYYRLWMKNHLHQIDEIVATDCATEQKLILPFPYKQGAVQDDGALYYDGTYFVSDETAHTLAKRVNEWGLKNCTASVIDETALLISYGNSRYRMYQTSRTSYNWSFEGLSYKLRVKSGNHSYYQFPIYLCQVTDTVIDEFNQLKGDITSNVATYQDFVDFYTNTGLYRFTAQDDTIVLLGYANGVMHRNDTLFPLTISFTEAGGTLTITFS